MMNINHTEEALNTRNDTLEGDNHVEAMSRYIQTRQNDTKTMNNK